MDLSTSPRLYAYTGGKPFDAAKPTVVFLHGAQHDHSVWILQSRYLAHHGYGVLALDLPGHMRSDGPPLETVEEIADRIAAALRSAGVSRLVAVGHSMGSLIALELAKRMPQQARGVALVATAFPMRVADPLLNATRDAPEEALDMINVWSHSPSIGGFDRKPSNPGPGFSNMWQNLRLMQRILRRDGRDVLPIDFVACSRYSAGLETAAALQCPVLFVLGSADSMTPPRAAKALIDACRQPQVVTLPHAGHALMSENPDGVRTAIADFARRVFAPAS
ncbi:MAG: alpha/beta fold hydrolase [Betaproteobacteria bacterium]